MAMIFYYNHKLASYYKWESIAQQYQTDGAGIIKVHLSLSPCRAYLLGICSGRSCGPCCMGGNTDWAQSAMCPAMCSTRLASIHTSGPSGWSIIRGTQHWRRPWRRLLPGPQAETEEQKAVLREYLQSASKRVHSGVLAAKGRWIHADAINFRPTSHRETLAFLEVRLLSYG
jgi:hypothetical protein